MTGNLSYDAEALRRIPLFAEMSPTKLKLLAFACDRLRFAAGERLFAQGDYGDAAYVILSGEVDIVVSTEERSVRVARLGQHDFVGEMAILCDVPRTATAEATTDQPVETLKIHRNAFFELLETSPEMAIRVTRELAHRLAKTTQELLVSRS